MFAALNPPPAPYFPAWLCSFVDSRDGLGGAYAAIKRLGESYLAAVMPPGLGRAVRFWNVYGREPISARSHVLADWAAQCARGGAIRSATDALERRQFLHVDDAAAAMIAAWQHWDEAFAQRGSNSGSGVSSAGPPALDISSGVWASLRDVAALMSDVATSGLGLPPCPLLPHSRAAAPRPEIAPGSHALSERWAEWVGGQEYPADAPARTTSGDADSAPAAHSCAACIPLRHGLRQMLAAHVAANATAAATAALP